MIILRSKHSFIKQFVVSSIQCASGNYLFFVSHEKLRFDLVLIDLRLHAMSKTVLKGDYVEVLINVIELFDLSRDTNFEEIQHRAVE